MFVYKVYTKVDNRGCIIAVGSSAFISSLDGWIEIDQGSGDRYQHAQANYLPGPLLDTRGGCRYKMLDGALVERTAEEMDADVKPPEKTPLERLAKVEDALTTITNIISKLGLK